MFAALVSLAIVSACGSVHRILPPENVGTQGAIPWLPLPSRLRAPVAPSPTPSQLPFGTQPCTGSQLQVDLLGSNGGTGHVFTTFGFSGLGPDACFVQGTPTVALFDGSGRRLPFNTRPPYMPPLWMGPVLIELAPLPDPHNALKYGQAALTVDWVSQPEPCPGGAGVQVAVAKITLPSGGPALTVALPTKPLVAYTCQGLGIGAFEGPLPTIDQQPPQPLPAMALQAPSSVRAGQELVYRVTMTNDTKLPMDLVASCPNYEEELFLNDGNGGPPLGGKHFFQLNCTPAGTIKPNASVTFEMRFAVPRDAAPGSYTLAFMLGYWNAMTKWTNEQVIISA